MDTATTRRVALVSGGGKGIGKVVSEHLARSGYAVALVGRDREALASTEAAVTGAGGLASSFVCDVRVSAEVREAVVAAKAALGPVAVLVCNAGIAGPTAPCEEVTDTEWSETLETNLNGSFYLCREVIPLMRGAGGGSIVLIGSTTGKRPVANRTPYAASKSALIGFGRSLAAEVGKYAITVNTICPGVVEGERWDRVVMAFAASAGVSAEEITSRYQAETFLNHFVTPQDIAEAVHFLASKGGRNITGQDLNVCAGLITY